MNSREAERLRQKLLQQAEEEREKACSDTTYFPKDTLSIQYIGFQKIQPVLQKLMERNYKHIKKICINNCDLRTFQNFPSLPNLVEVNAAKNSMRGSFEFIVKNRGIKYMDVSDNYIADIKRFQPLRMLKDISIFAKGNPFMKLVTNPLNGGGISKDSPAWKIIKSYGVTLLKQAKKTEEKVKVEVQAKNQNNGNKNKIKEELSLSIMPNSSAMKGPELGTRIPSGERDRFTIVANDDSEQDFFIRSQGNPFLMPQPGQVIEHQHSLKTDNLLRLIRERGELESFLNAGGSLRITRPPNPDQPDLMFMESDNIPDDDDDDDDDGDDDDDDDDGMQEEEDMLDEDDLEEDNILDQFDEIDSEEDELQN